MNNVCYLQIFQTHNKSQFDLVLIVSCGKAADHTSPCNIVQFGHVTFDLTNISFEAFYKMKYWSKFFSNE